MSGAGNCFDATTLALQDGVVCDLINAFPATEIEARFEKTDALRGPSHLTQSTIDQMDSLFPLPPLDTFFVLDISVDPSAQNTGLGKALMDHAEGLARAAGCSGISLHVRETNPALGFYQHLGFEVRQRAEEPALGKHGIKAYLQMTRAIHQ